MKFTSQDNRQEPALSPAETIKDSPLGHPGPTVAQLVHDSGRAPSTAGVRGGYTPARQLLYKAGSVCVDMRVEPELGSNEVVLVGQLMDSRTPGFGLGDITVSLLCDAVPISQKRTNAVGEFQFGFRELHQAQLIFGMGQRGTLIVPVPDTEPEQPPQA